MGRVLAGLIDQPEALVELAVKKLEHMSGFQSEDVRLLAQIEQTARAKTTQLGLDPDDTTGPELYYGLIAKLAKDEASLNLDRAQVLKKLASLYKPYKVYALRRSVAKELLRQKPPRKLMKQLNYRSVESMLKRENIAELYAVLEAVESPTWIKNFWKSVAKLSPSDFEPQKIELVEMPKGCWSSLNQNQATHNPLLGTINVWPGTTSSMHLAVQVINSVQQLRSACAFIKLKQVQPDFGKQLVAALQNGLDHPSEVSHLPINWHTIFRHYGQRAKIDHTEFFGPHLLHEDIKLVQSLVQISPVFKWWEGLEHVLARTTDGLVSFNLADLLQSQHASEFKNQKTENAHGAVWHELVNRYMSYPAIEAWIMRKFSGEPVLVEDLPNAQPNPQDIKQLMETI